jgi:hypothetical protein
MKQNLINFINTFESTDSELVTTLLESINVLFEEPHIDAPKDVMVKQLHNNFTSDDLLGIKKKKRNQIHVNNIDEFDAFDLYIEQTGMQRADGVIHEPMRYIRDISLGKAVISPRDNVSIKLSKSDGIQFLKWITHNRYAMLSIRNYLHENPDKVMELPTTFYNDAVRNKTMSSKEVADLLPSPRNIHESK